jgi:hypothetical protein
MHLMKFKYFAIGVVALVVLAASALAADISGKWTVKAGEADITLVFKVDGAKLTGTIDNPQSGGGPVDITDGKIEGENVSFLVVRKMNEMEMKIAWKGKIAGEEIKFKREMQGGMGGPGGGGMGGPGGGGMGGPGGGQAEEFIAKRAK